jgi:hypothetical protein
MSRTRLFKRVIYDFCFHYSVSGAVKLGVGMDMPHKTETPPLKLQPKGATPPE